MPLKQRLVNWLLRDITIDKLHIRRLRTGEHSITLSPAAGTDVARWSGTQAAAAAGDLGMNVTTGSPLAFVGGASRAIPVTEAGSSGGGVPLRDRLAYSLQRDMRDAGTTLVNVGSGAWHTATATVAALADATGAYIDYDTGGVINTDAGISPAAGYDEIQTQFNPFITAVIKTGTDITSSRYWIGVFSATPMASATPAVHLAAFRYDTVADGTAFWRAVTDSGTGAPTVTVTTTAIAANTRYVLEIDSTNPASIRFLINGVLVATHTLTLPTTTQALSHHVMLRNLAAASRTIRFNRLKVSHN